MGECIGVGLPHAPMFQFPDAAMADVLKKQLNSSEVPDYWKDQRHWPAPMREEWGTDDGLAAAQAHREIVVSGLRRVRAALDEFSPDVVVVFGDDQYENFREDIVPTFCLYMLDDVMDVLPFRGSAMVGTRENVWGRAEDTVVQMHGHAGVTHLLADGLIDTGFDIAWSTRPHHHPTLSHAFMRTLMYLDYDQKGFPWPYVPFHVNAYGRDIGPRVARETGRADFCAPPAPSPARCFALGQAVGQILRESPYRAAIVGSSSWSHGFLTEKNHLLWPDTDSDRARLAELEDSRHRQWANLTLDQVRDAGQHEMLNWICLAGAMADASAEVLAFAPTWIFNSTKVVALLHE